jgi:hypothetical protein
VGAEYTDKRTDVGTYTREGAAIHLTFTGSEASKDLCSYSGIEDATDLIGKTVTVHVDAASSDIQDYPKFRYPMRLV